MPNTKIFIIRTQKFPDVVETVLYVTLCEPIKCDAHLELHLSARVAVMNGLIIISLLFLSEGLGFTADHLVRAPLCRFEHNLHERISLHVCMQLLWWVTTGLWRLSKESASWFCIVIYLQKKVRNELNVIRAITVSSSISQRPH